MFKQCSAMRTVPIFATLVGAMALAMTVPAFAQNTNPSGSNDAASASNPANPDNPSASESMHQAGQDVKNAGSSSAQAVEDAAHGTATAVSDSAITAKVKTAVHNDKATGSEKIHVATVAGVVTLKGRVSTEEAARRAEELAQQTYGVKGVENKLTVASSGAMN